MPFLAAITVYLHFDDNGSLKGKRKELVSLRSVLNRRFGAAVAEVDHHDLWQRSTLVLALVGSSHTDLDHLVDGVERYLLSRHPESVRIERRLVSFEDLS
ncbi:MAG: DUF503 domain-containing protein [Solirubrobacterales bacterium]